MGNTTELKDVVILSIPDYNKLRDFRNEILKETPKVTFNTDRSYGFTIYSNDDAMKKAEDANNKLLDRIRILEEKYDNLRRAYEDKKYVEVSRLKEEAVEEFSSMSVWKFWRWKRKL